MTKREVMQQVHCFLSAIAFAAVLLAALLLLLTPTSWAQSSGGPYQMTRSVVAGGGGTSTAGPLQLEGTIGQPVAGRASTGSPFSEAAGFWSANAQLPSATNGAISGRVASNEGAPVSGTVIILSGAQSRKTITDVNGDYRFDNVETDGFYNVTPSRANYSFSPANRSFSQIGNRTEATFTAVATGDSLNPLDTAEYFVRQQYIDLLGREPDEAGFNYWSDQILLCRDDHACVHSRRVAVAAAFFIEQEFQLTGSFIFNMYACALGRRPLVSEYWTDHARVTGGANPDLARQGFAENFVQRSEFVEKYQNDLSGESFVDALLRSLRQNSAVDLTSERANLLDRYVSGANLNQSRVQVLLAVADDQTFKRTQYNSAFVLTEYFGYLRRDADSAGFDFWLNVLNNREPDNFRGMVCSFVTSAEYQRRFSSVVTHGNAECAR